MQFRNIDRPSTPQEVTIHFERRQQPDEHPDISHLEQDYADVVDEAEREKYRAADRARLEAYNNGDWHMRGLFVRACISVPIGGGSFCMFHLDSPGLWGVESDCGDAYEQEIWRDEERQLKDMMATMAPAFAALATEPAKRLTAREWLERARDTLDQRTKREDDTQLIDAHDDICNALAALKAPYVCSDFHRDPQLPEYCEGCKQPRSAHSVEG